MSDMKLVVVGAAGRMGRTLIRAVAAAPGVTLHAAIEREGSPEIGADAGVLAGLPPLGIPVTTDALAAVVGAEASSTSPRRRRRCVSPNSPPRPASST